MSKSNGLPYVDADAVPLPPPRSFLHRHRLWATCLIIPLLFLSISFHHCTGVRTLLPGVPQHDGHHISAKQCPQVAPLLPQQSSKELLDMDTYLKSAAFREESIKRLSASVQIPTESFDDMGPIGKDKRWEIFYEFAAYLNKTFPLVHSKLKLDVVNVHGLVYTWKGEFPALKPTLLMAHQDVVPVPASTVDSWTHPPFSGLYDGKFIWGRGASDCKNQLLAIMESVELLLHAGFTPRRTVILSFGFDEEISGTEGAGHLAPFLLERYGKDSIAAIVDEGAGISTLWGSTFAAPAVAEKGALDVDIVVRMPGGHSSIPPSHNGIGVMSELVTLIEAQPYSPRLDDSNPYLGLLTCGAEHSPSFPKKLKKLLSSSSKRRKLAIEAAKASLGIRYLMTTSAAVDVIAGGVKVNALPERTSATVNHRVNVGEHPSQVKTKLTLLALKVTQKYNLTLHAFSANATETPSSITLTALPTELEPAPVTPTDISHGASAYAILSGTVRALYGSSILMAPGLTTGNTDTRYYWDLTRNIFRFGPGWDSSDEGGLGNIHTVDEKVSVTAHVSAAQWFSLFVRNMDEADLA